MPELPEVETVVRGLRRLLTGQTIRQVEILWDRAISTPAPDAFCAGLCGQRITGADRRGKYVILHLDRGDLLAHLRMTGQLLVVPADDESRPRHLRVAITCDGRRLLFLDTRKFGRMYWVPDAGEILGDLGPEPLDDGFTGDVLAGAICGRRAPVKSLLLNQHIVAGIGNIYADEALFQAGISPHRKGCELSRVEVESLCAAIRAELARGIENRGTTFSDYRDANGRRGEHRAHLRVYGRGGEPCLCCGSEIVRSRVGGRSSYHCPVCQH